MKHDFAKMRHRHENVLLWLVNNPGGNQRECAAGVEARQAAPHDRSRVLDECGELAVSDEGQVFEPHQGETFPFEA